MAPPNTAAPDVDHLAWVVWDAVVDLEAAPPYYWVHSPEELVTAWASILATVRTAARQLQGYPQVHAPLIRAAQWIEAWVHTARGLDAPARPDLGEYQTLVTECLALAVQIRTAVDLCEQ
jgi:hypothetical protein